MPNTKQKHLINTLAHRTTHATAHAKHITHIKTKTPYKPYKPPENKPC